MIYLVSSLWENDNNIHFTQLYLLLVSSADPSSSSSTVSYHTTSLSTHRLELSFFFAALNFILLGFFFSSSIILIISFTSTFFVLHIISESINTLETRTMQTSFDSNETNRQTKQKMGICLFSTLVASGNNKFANRKIVNEERTKKKKKREEEKEWRKNESSTANCMKVDTSNYRKSLLCIHLFTFRVLEREKPNKIIK